MVNNYSKMRRGNVKARAWLEEHGYKDIHLFPHTMWSKDVNIGSCAFDGIASDENCLVLFQIKSNKRVPGLTAEAFLAMSKKYNCSCIWLNCIDRKPVEVYATKFGEFKWFT